MRLEAHGPELTLGGRPFRVLSGAIHYFRVPPAYWRDRLEKLRACGLNTVETYVPWNLHEPREREFCFDGWADIVSFIGLAGELGLRAIVRPSPYICAEWDFGGLPAWLLADADMRLRCSHPPFLEKIDRYYDALIPRLLPLLSTNGGPVIAMQIENEYGSYGNDAVYMAYVRDALVRRGVDVLLFTSDGAEDGMLQGGTLPGALATVNFGSRPLESFAKLREYRPNAPLVCMEFWNGWFDHWGEKHHTREAEDVAAVLETMLLAGASVNFYMFHGGTQFGFFNGANSPPYAATTTSYDSHALLDEAGDPTPKYAAVQQTIARCLPGAADLTAGMPEPGAKAAYGRFILTERAALLDNLTLLGEPRRTVVPEPMEKLGQDYGFVLYSTRLSGPREESRLFLQEVRDRAQIFLDGEPLGVLARDDPAGASLTLDIPVGGGRLDILVENTGRINYGPFLADRKGITEGVRLNNQFLFHWDCLSMPLATPPELPFCPFALDEAADSDGQPAFYRGTFEIAGPPEDTFLSMNDWTRGVVYVNGFNLGRYWERGPQRTLYVPAPLLKEGGNELVVFELHGTGSAAVEFVAGAVFE